MTTGTNKKPGLLQHILYWIKSWIFKNIIGRYHWILNQISWTIYRRKVMAEVARWKKQCQPNCKHCHGRGYEGYDLVHMRFVECRCVDKMNKKRLDDSLKTAVYHRLKDK